MASVGPPKFVLRHRSLVATTLNLLIVALAYTASFLLRFDLQIPEPFRGTWLATMPAAVLIQYVSLSLFKLTRGWWRYVSVSDVINAVRGAVVGNLGIATWVFLFHRDRVFPRSIFLLNFVTVVGLSIGLRLTVRLWRRSPAQADTVRRRLLIVGAGDKGEALLREIRQSGRLPYHPVAFLDDSQAKQGSYIHGVPVLGSVDALPAVVEKSRIEEVVVATPSASGTELRRIMDLARKASVPFKVLPATSEVLDRDKRLAPRAVNIDDLLRRPPVQLDTAGIERFLRGKRVLVTGAAGSIGSEICRQVLRFEPTTLVCLDHDENALFFLERSLVSAERSALVHFRLADITDARSMSSTFAEFAPQVVFHAAAHKHVSVLEANPIEGVRNNVFGTETVARLAGETGAEAFVLISTDKAVNPTSVMGTTKRIAELLIQTLPHKTRFTAVRFGNVLGSQGSVVPILTAQIAAGGPVTVTHPDMKRFFMTIPEAVQLVIQGGAMGRENQVYMLDMGDPVRIVDLAHDLIELSGLRPNIDIKIEFTGARPGEKLFEELHLPNEHVDKTSHPKIMVVATSNDSVAKLHGCLEELRLAVDKHDARAALRLIRSIVPEYSGNPSMGDNIIPISVARAG